MGPKLARGRWPVRSLAVAAAAIAVVGTVAGCGSSPSGKAPSGSSANTTTYNIKFMLNFAPNGEDSAFYYGKKLGLFAKNGVNLTIVPGTTSANTITAVTSGQIDIGFASVKNLLTSGSAGEKTVSIGNMYGIGSNGVFVPKSSGITSITQLSGKTIIAADSGIEALLSALIKSKGGNPSTIHYATVTPAAIVTTYVGGQGDGLLTSVPFAEAEVNASRPSNVITLASAGLNIPDYTFFVAPSYLQSNKPAIRAFLKAMYESVSAALKNPTAAGAAVHEAVSSVNGATAAQTFKYYSAYICAPSMNGQTIGYMSQSDWNKAVTHFAAVNLVPKSFSASGMLTNQFVSGTNAVTSQTCPLPAS